MYIKERKKKGGKECSGRGREPINHNNIPNEIKNIARKQKFKKKGGGGFFHCNCT